MADPLFIQTPRGGEWVVRLSTQTGTASGSPPTDGLALTAGSNGAFIESITCVPLGVNASQTLYVYTQYESTTRLLGAVAISSAGATDAATRLAILPTCLFPAAATDNDKKGLRLAPGAKVYCALSASVAAGWDIHFNGGDC